MALSANLREEVGAEDTDSEHGDRKGDNEVHKRSENLTDLQVHASNGHLEVSDTLASSCCRGQERGDDALGECGEELGDDAAEVDGGGDDDNILGIEHLFVGPEKKRILFGQVYGS